MDKVISELKLVVYENQKWLEDIQQKLMYGSIVINNELKAKVIKAQEQILKAQQCLIIISK